MKNVKPTQLKTAICLTSDEYENVLQEIFGQKIVVHADLDGIWYEASSDDCDVDNNLLEKLKEYFDVNDVTSVHADDCEYVGIWIIYR